MRASELIEFLAKTIKELNRDVDVYFDTEAASFDVHYVEISEVAYVGELIVGEDMAVLKCHNSCYNHK